MKGEVKIDVVMRSIIKQLRRRSIAGENMLLLLLRGRSGSAMELKRRKRGCCICNVVVVVMGLKL